MIYIVSILLLLFVYMFGLLLDMVQKRFGFTTALITFITGGFSFVTFIKALIGLL